MTTKATLTLKSGAKVTVNVETTPIRPGKIQARITLRDKTVYASGPTEHSAIQAAHSKAFNTF